MSDYDKPSEELKKPRYMGDIVWLSTPPKDAKLAQKLIKEGKAYIYQNPHNPNLPYMGRPTQYLFPYEKWYQYVYGPYTEHTEIGGQHSVNRGYEWYEDYFYKNLYDDKDILEGLQDGLVVENDQAQGNCDNEMNRLTKCHNALEQASFNQSQSMSDFKPMSEVYKPRATASKKSRFSNLFK
ncbi:MAG: hypothetical protein Sylvanvirus12_24 [Sylvanvirus sp.]|uniref:Uncharacterized protein n=1 Tax=Sylvanvirus sp. TaxID=2487774 RepID=A0A3G5AI48_9VIRU|nr:MAG: hypothetical protein Sylvanvirus12_24 [Sylvanvirus sp.]